MFIKVNVFGRQRGVFYLLGYFVEGRYGAFFFTVDFVKLNLAGPIEDFG